MSHVLPQTCNMPEVGTELFKYLHEQPALVALLSERKDEDGKPVVGIYRGNVPQFDQMAGEAVQCTTNEEFFEVVASHHIDDFLVFEQADEEYPECISGCSLLPSRITFDVQIVSDSLRRAIKIKRAFLQAINKLNGCCETDPCERIRPQKMCNMLICKSQTTGASEDNQRLTAASDFAMSAFDLELILDPLWSK